MMFDPKSYELRQWTITDAQGKDTTVMIFNTKEGVSLSDDLFTIDYTANRELNTKGGNR
jgi:outer membrane lipoprotein-sorting protein